MTNRSGADYERRVVEYMQPVWPHMDRDRKRGRFDKGEFVGTGDWTLECKNTREIRLSQALKEAEHERQTAGKPWCAAIINHKNYAIGKSYVVMSLEQFRKLVVEL